jgi:hypothetical protein|tara:strand:+ start:310 stop:525 length:216 start_codon:yes stop_codon:yes gene_type:complete
MNTAQIAWLNNVTPKKAEALLDKFDYDINEAYEKSEAAVNAFRFCWEIVNPRSYWQRVNLATGTYYNLVAD